MRPDDDPSPDNPEDISPEEPERSPANEAIMVWFGIGGAMAGFLFAQRYGLGIALLGMAGGAVGGTLLGMTVDAALSGYRADPQRIRRAFKRRPAYWVLVLLAVAAAVVGIGSYFDLWEPRQWFAGDSS